MKLKVAPTTIGTISSFNQYPVVPSFEEAAELLKSNNYVGCVWKYDHLSKHWSLIYDNSIEGRIREDAIRWWQKVESFHSSV